MKNRQCYNIKYCIYKSVILTIILTISSIQLKGQNADEDEVKVTEYSDTLICKDHIKYPYNYLLIECKDKIVQKKVNLYILFFDNFIFDEYDYNPNIYTQYKSVETSKIVKMIKDSIEQKEATEQPNFEDYLEFNSDKLLSTYHRVSNCSNPRGNVSYHNFDLRTGEKIFISDIITKEGKLGVYDLIQRKIIDRIKKEKFILYTKNKLLSHKYKGIDFYHLNDFIFDMAPDKIPGVKFYIKNSEALNDQQLGCVPFYDLTISFKELEPFLTEDFRKRVWIPIKKRLKSVSKNK